MKIPIVSLFTFLLCLSAKAQTYPFNESFEGYPANAIAPPWGGDIQVKLAHGTNDSKALAADMRSTNKVDSVVSPLIGPLTPASVLSFFYRVVDFANWPSTPTNFDAGDSIFAMMTTDGVNYRTIYQIDDNNHNPSFNLKKIKVFITQYVGDTVHIKFVCKFGHVNRYYVDIDSVMVANDPSISGVEDLNDAAIVSLFPNPVSANQNCNVTIDNNEVASASIINLSGQVLSAIHFTANCQLPIANLPDGLYFVRIQQHEKILTRKLIIQR